MEDSVRANHEERLRVFCLAFDTWTALKVPISLDGSSTQALDKFPRLFPNHPPLPRRPRLHKTLGSLFATGVSTWCCGQEYTSDIPAFSRPYQIPVTSHTPTRIKLSTNNPPIFPSWVYPVGNHVSVLVLAWTYILSARWADLITQAEAIHYTDNIANNIASGRSAEETKVVIKLSSEIDEPETRWWAAVLAPRCGWAAATSEGLQSPWVTSLDPAIPFVLHCRRNPDTRRCTGDFLAPSYSTALRYLSEYCAFHDAWGHSHVALAIALIIPFANRQGKRLSLHCSLSPSAAGFGLEKGISTGNQPLKGLTDPYPISWYLENQSLELDRLLALSCNTSGVESILQSIFYQPGIPSNLCGSWLQGSFAVLDLIIDDTELLAETICNRDAKSSYLWLGAIASGLHKDIFDACRLGMAEIELHAAAWTSSIQSFIQEPVTGLVSDSMISRGDECRILYLTQTKWHTNVPPFPWPPFGDVSVMDANLEVQEHARCVGHGLRYIGWEWDLVEDVNEPQNEIPPPCSDKSALFPFPVELPNHNEHVAVAAELYEAIDHSDEESASQMVTANNFYWLRGTDGYPVSEKNIRTHEWLWNESESELESSDSERSCNGQRRTRSTAGRGLGSWFLRIRRDSLAESI